MPKLGTIHWKKFEEFLLENGCVFIKQESRHRKYHKAGLLRPVIIPKSKSIPPFIVLNNLRTLGIDRKKYTDFLKKGS